MRLRGFGIRRRLRQLRAESAEHMLEWRRNRSLRSIARRESGALNEARRSASALPSEPLVSVTIATWNRAAILCERTIPSVLAQSYGPFEVIIVGDCCTDDTAERIAAIDDPRVRFVNLEKRGDYPTQPFRRHCVAGSIPMMAARDLARGEWIAHLDDDEVWTVDHLASLLRAAVSSDAELIWGRTRYEVAPGQWRVEGTADFATFDIPHSSVLMRQYLKLYREDLQCWKLKLGADRHRFRRMYFSGVRAGFVDEIITLGPLRPDTTRQWVESEDRERLQ